MEYFNAFWVGGAICLLAQILIDLTKLTPARILTGCVVLGVILSATGVFSHLADFAGAGVSVPLLGFGDVMAQGVKEAIDTRGAVGILTGGMTASAGGITAAVFFGLVSAIFGKSKAK